MNFDLLILPHSDTYQARVVNSPVGQALGHFTLPFTQAELDLFAWRPGADYRHLRPATTTKERKTALDPQEFGTCLFGAVFEGEVRTCLRRSLDRARRQNEHLRVRLRLNDVPELALLPWEYLYDLDRDQFFALLDQISLMRYMEIPEPEEPLQAESPLRILVMVAKPQDTQPLAVEREWERLQQALQTLVDQGKVVLEKLKSATNSELQQQLRRNEYHIFHFIGHGWFDEKAETSGLLFEDEQGNGLPVTAKQLGVLLQGHQTFRFVFLNACEGARTLSTAAFGGTAQYLVRQSLPAVVAMQFPVTDRAAIHLAQEFYRALADSYPVDRAVTEARKAIFTTRSSHEWATPVLFLRSDNGRLFDVSLPAAREETDAEFADAKSNQVINNSSITTGSIEGVNVNVGGVQHIITPTHVKQDFRKKQPRVTTVAGNQFNVSSDFRSAVLNMKSQLENVTQIIRVMPHTNGPTKQKLVGLMIQLNELLAQVPAEHSEEAQNVVKRMSALMQEANQDFPNEEMTATLGRSLLNATEKLTQPLPNISAIVKQIVELINLRQWSSRVMTTTSFIDQWRVQCTESIVEFAKLISIVQEVDFKYGLMATAVLWPVRELILDDDGDAIDAVRAITEADANYVLKAVRHLSNDRLEAARSLAIQTDETPELQYALDILITYFDAALHFANHLYLLYKTKLDNNVTIDQIQAALVNVGGIVNIHSLNVQITRQIEIPTPPKPNRPSEVVNFVGREAELTYYVDKLKSNHLAVISGSAGVGKTYLAVRLAHYIAQDQNVFWHSFHHNEGFETIIWQLAGFLAWHKQDELWRMLQGIRQTGGQTPPPEILFNYILQEAHNRNYLFCFDDFHYVVSDPVLVQFVERLREVVSAGGLDMILTTRELPAFVQLGEFDALEGLSLADICRLLEIEGISLSNNLTTDLHRHTSGNAQFLILAIDALKHTDNPALLIEHLAESDNIERYLLTEVDESLTVEERRVMNVLAVLLGDFATRQTIESILNGSSLLKALRRLTDRHLLIVRGEAKEREYNLHAMVQSFYYELMEQHERRNLHSHVANFYEIEKQDFFKAILHFERADEHDRIVDLAVEHTIDLMNFGHTQQLLPILEHLLENKLNPAQWAAVNVSKGELYVRAGELQLAPQCLRRALKQIELMPRMPSTDEMKARVCRGMGTLLQYKNPKEALKWFGHGLEALDSNPASKQIPALHIYIGSVQGMMGKYNKAQQAIEQGLKRLPSGPSLLLVDTMLGLAAIHTDQGEVEEAYQHVQQALELAQQLNASFHIVNIRDQLGTLLYHKGDWSASIEEGHKALALAEQLGSVPARTRLSLNLGCTYISTGDDDKALEHLQTSLNLARKYDHLQEFQIGAQASLAELYVRRQEYDTAVPLLQEAKCLAKKIKLSYQLPEIHRNCSLVHLSKGELQAALDTIQQSLKMARRLKAKLEVGMSLRTLADVRLNMSAPLSDILRLYEESITNLAENAYEAARTKVRLGQLLLEGSDPGQGKVLLQKAYLLFKELGAKRDLADLAERYSSEMSSL